MRNTLTVIKLTEKQLASNTACGKESTKNIEYYYCSHRRIENRDRLKQKTLAKRDKKIFRAH